MSKPKLAYSKAEAAEAVGVSERTIQREIKAGRLPVYTPVGRPLILHDDLMSWLTTDRKTA